ncbi:MAG TPA: RGCVC family protein [Actinophytocola sp.]|jgi:hypothetical protein|nr:RGCVC family protein [Actinophytocola sp.]
MPATTVIPDSGERGSGHAPDDEVARGCAACPHVWTAHDPIAARFCTATVGGQFSRGCVCAPTTTLT